MSRAGKIRRGLRNPSMVLGALYDVYFSRLASHEGVDFFARDWDNLLVLDACRYDLFEAVSTLPGDLSPVHSPASQTREFLEKTVDGRTFEDVVYATANPQLTRVDARFADVVPLWEDAWDDELGTVPADRVVDWLLDHRERFDDKRLVAHFVQPHIPFVGPTGRRLRQPGFQGDVLPNRGDDVENVWQRLRKGEVSKAVVWEAYRENLELALPAVERLVRAVAGKTVVTSDHGNALGEWLVFGHPPNRHIDALTRVPWLTIDGARRECTPAEDTVATRDIDPTAVTERLRHLGYAE